MDSEFLFGAHPPPPFMGQVLSVQKIQVLDVKKIHYRYITFVEIKT